MNQETTGLFVLLGLIVLAMVSVIAVFAFAMHEEDHWFEEDKARADAEDALPSSGANVSNK
nr:hypothetical protein [uncultured Rhodoferax sp.]